MTKKNEWEIQRDKQNALRAKTMKSLTADKLNELKQTHKTITYSLAMLRECNDLYLSDIRKLDDAFWKLKNEFNLENSHE